MNYDKNGFLGWSSLINFDDDKQIVFLTKSD